MVGQKSPEENCSLNLVLCIQRQPLHFLMMVRRGRTLLIPRWENLHEISQMEKKKKILQFRKIRKVLIGSCGPAWRLQAGTTCSCHSVPLEEGGEQEEAGRTGSSGHEGKCCTMLHHRATGLLRPGSGFRGTAAHRQSHSEWDWSKSHESCDERRKRRWHGNKGEERLQFLQCCSDGMLNMVEKLLLAPQFVVG